MTAPINLPFRPDPVRIGSDFGYYLEHLEEFAREAVEADRSARSEPVAWMHTNAVGDVYFRKKPQDRVFNPQPVFLCPPAERAPLTDQQLQDILSCIDPLTRRLPPGLKEFARAIEAAHGVKP